MLHANADVTDISLSPDGRRLAVVDGTGNVAIYDSDNGTLLATASRYGPEVLLSRFLKSDTDPGIFNIVFSPDGTKLISLDSNGEISIWREDRGWRREAAMFGRPTALVGGIGWSKGGRPLVITCDGGRASTD